MDSSDTRGGSRRTYSTTERESSTSVEDRSTKSSSASEGEVKKPEPEKPPPVKTELRGFTVICRACNSPNVAVFVDANGCTMSCLICNEGMVL